MSRPHIEFIRSAEVDEAPLDDTRLAGLPARVLSADDETGALTAIVTVPAGTEVDLADPTRPSELLVLRGRGTLGDSLVEEGAYAFVPVATPDGRLTVEEDLLVLYMWEDEGAGRDTVGGPVEVIDTTERRLEEHGTPNVPPGLVIKLLRVDEERGDWTWLASTPPAWQEDRAEIHPTVEEALVLRGDVLLGRRGAMGPGDYFWRAPNIEHGPMYTHEGHVIFFRTKGGGMEVTHVEVPGWRELVEEYKAKEPFYVG